MTDITITFITSFVGGALGGMLGVWLAWRRIKGEVMQRLAQRLTGL